MICMRNRTEVTRPPRSEQSAVRFPSRPAPRLAAMGGVVALVAVSLGNGPVVSQDAAPVVAPGADRVGSYSPRAPLHPAEASAPASADTLRRHMEAGDHVRALRVAEEVAESSASGRERAAARMVIGLLHREAGRHNLASEAFTQVRAGGGPLAPLAAYYESEQDLARGREWVAIKECEAYREAWPKGDHAGACLRIIATAHARLGRTAAARAAAQQYDSEHANATITEQIERQLAEQRMASDDPASAISMLQRLAVDHASPLTGRVAEELLAELRAQGHEDAVIPDDVESRKQRAVSLRDVKRKDDAWAAFERLMADAEEDPSLASWVEGAAERFGWRAHRWDFLADMYGRAYAEDADAEYLWSQFKVLGRGGRHDDAANVAVVAQKAHGASRDWRRKEEYVGQTMLLAGRYPEAVAQFDAVAARGGWTGRRNRFFAGFASLMGGDAEGAVERLTPLVEADRGEVEASRYWRAKAYDLLEKPDLAEADRAWLRSEASGSWYAIWLRQGSEDQPSVAPLARDGSWAGAPHPPAPALAVVDGRWRASSEAPVPMARPLGGSPPVAGSPVGPPPSSEREIDPPQRSAASAGATERSSRRWPPWSATSPPPSSSASWRICRPTATGPRPCTIPRAPPTRWPASRTSTAPPSPSCRPHTTSPPSGSTTCRGR